MESLTTESLCVQRKNQDLYFSILFPVQINGSDDDFLVKKAKVNIQHQKPTLR